MALINPCYPKFIKGRDSQNGLAGYLQHMVRAFGQATVAQGGTTIAVSDTDALASDVIIASMQAANGATYVGVAITGGTGYTFTVSGTVGSGGAVIAYIRLRLQN